MKISSKFTLELDKTEFVSLAKFLGKNSENSFRQTLKGKLPIADDDQHDSEVRFLLDLTHKLLDVADSINRFRFEE